MPLTPYLLSCETCHYTEHVACHPRPYHALLNAGALENAILTSSTFAIIATDIAGVIQVFNVGACRMLGYEAAEMIDRVQPCQIHEPHLFALRAADLSRGCGAVVETGLEVLTYKASRALEDIYETSFLCKDGSLLPTRVSITALRDQDGAIIGYLMICTDNSEHIRVENLLKEAISTAESASAAKSEFLSRMSHELRTPLNAILGFAQLIETGTPQPTAQQKSGLHQILNAGWYLLALINEVLDLAMVESGRMNMASEAVSVGEVLQDCQTMIEPQAEKLGVTLSFTLPDTALYVFADRIRLKQVLINLLVNAVKYNRPQGRVVVDFVSHSSGSLRINVRDTGLGMTPEQVKQLFQPFNRLGREGGAEDGTGIGLVVTKRLVELMGGSIGVESQVGQGSVFWIDMKQAGAPQLADGSRDTAVSLYAQAAAGLPLRTILYVEDNPANLVLVEELIARRPDLRFMSAADAETGIALARAWLPEVILMDINLPGMSGIEAMLVLLADPVTTHIPVLALSANAVPRDIEKGLAAGFRNYLTKPIKVAQFMEALDLALLETPRPAASQISKEAA